MKSVFMLILAHKKDSLWTYLSLWHSDTGQESRDNGDRLTEDYQQVCIYQSKLKVPSRGE